MFPPRLRPYLFELLSTLQYPHTIAQRHPCLSSVAVIDRGTCQQPLLTPSRRSLWHHQDSNPMTKVKSCSVKALNIKKKKKNLRKSVSFIMISILYRRIAQPYHRCSYLATENSIDIQTSVTVLEM